MWNNRRRCQRSKDPAEPQQTPSSTVGSPESSNSKVKFADKEEEEENIALPTYEEIKTIFESMDKDGDGLISFAEVRRYQSLRSTPITQF